MLSLTPAQIADLAVLASFIGLYCKSKHANRIYQVPADLQRKMGKQLLLCRDCADLLEHGMKKRALCPLDPKPACKNCHIHCYTPEYRQQIRTIMAYSGKRMILKGRLDYLWHYYFKKQEK